MTLSFTIICINFLPLDLWGIKHEIVFMKSHKECPADVRHIVSVVATGPCRDNQSAGENQSFSQHFPGSHWSAGLTFGLWLAAVTHERGSNQSAIRWHSPSSHHTPLTLHTCLWWHTFGNIVCSEDGIMFGGCNNCVSNIGLTIFFYQNMNVSYD